MPEDLLRSIGLWDGDAGKGRLGGKKGDRVRPVRLRGELSQGLVFKPGADAAVGDDLAVAYGITKYEPKLPTTMSGQVANVGGFLVSYDIENIKKYPDVFAPGEMVVVTEKLHGTLRLLQLYPTAGQRLAPRRSAQRFRAGGVEGTRREGPGVQGRGGQQEQTSTCERGGSSCGTPAWWRRVEDSAQGPVHIMAEIFGRGVQDLHYGLARPSLRVFDVFLGPPATGSFLDHDALCRTTDAWGVDRVPELAVAPFSEELIEEHRDGPDTVSGRPHAGRASSSRPGRSGRTAGCTGDRVKLKAVSPDYLFRRGNRTEYE